MKFKTTLCALAAALTFGVAGCKKHVEMPKKEEYKNPSFFFVGDLAHSVLRDQSGNLAAVKTMPPSGQGISECFYLPGKENYCRGGFKYPMDNHTETAVLKELEAEGLARYELDRMRHLSRKTKK